MGQDGRRERAHHARLTRSWIRRWKWTPGCAPEGRNGPIVRTLASHAAYYDQWGATVEIQALLRAHQVAGDNDLGIAFLHMADRIRYPGVGCVG